MEKIKNAIITGANRGIGLATVKKFVENKINVWACMREPNPEIEEKFKMYEEEYGNKKRIEIIDSTTGSIGQALLVSKVADMINEDKE